MDHSTRNSAASPPPDFVREACRALRPAWFFWLSLAVFVVPTIADLARGAWTQEQNAHGPLIFASGLWLIARQRHAVVNTAQPGFLAVTISVVLPALFLFTAARVLGWLGVECLAAYAACIAIFYYHAGSAALRVLWFPLVYMIFMFPQLDTVILPLSRILKIIISTGAVDLLAHLGYQVARGGVVIYVDQYELLVATACSGLNSLLTLSAIGVFYTYVCYGGRWSETWPLLMLIFPIAVAANFTRVVMLILVTHYFGDAVGQGFVHDFAAIFMFAVALASLLSVDGLIRAFRRWASRRGNIRT